MNRYVKEIMAILKIDAATAYKIYLKMSSDGIDFSGCSSKTFRDAARRALDVVDPQQGR